MEISLLRLFLFRCSSAQQLATPDSDLWVRFKKILVLIGLSRDVGVSIGSMY